MDNLAIVKEITDAAINTMKEKKILASFTIACALYTLNKVSDEDAKTLMNAKNIMMKKAGKKYNEDVVLLEGARGARFKVYDSFEDCITEWLLTFKSSAIKDVWDLDTVIERVDVKDYNKSNLRPLCDAFKLEDIDKVILDELYPTNQSIIEVPVSTVAATYQEMSGCKVEKPKAVAKIPIAAPKEIKPVQLIRGEKITVRNVNLFKEASSTIAYRSFTGNLWLFNGTEVNGRYAVVTNKTFLGKTKDFIDGYVKKSDLV